MKKHIFSNYFVFRLLSAGLLLGIFASSLPAQAPFLAFLNKADDYYFNKKDYCNALDNYEKAMQIQELANYPMYHAAQSACQCGKPEKSFEYGIKSFTKFQDFYNYEYFESDTLNKCFSESPEWKKILAEMKPKYEAFNLRQKQFQESLNNQALRLNPSPGGEKALADSLNKLPVDKLVRYIQTYKNYQSAPQTDHWALYSINVKEIGDVPFMLYVPKDYRPSESKPLIVYLHGAVRGRQQFAVKSNPPEFEKDVIGKLTALNTFVIYPLARKDFNWLMHRAAFETISKEIVFAKNLYNINDNKVYIGGHSNGATGALWFALNNRTDYAGFFGFAISPVLNLGQSFYANLDNEQKLITLNGTKDNTFEYKNVSAVYEKAKAQNPNWILQPITNGDHNFMGDFPKEIETMLADLLKQNRNPFPHTITEQTDSEDTDPNFWLKISRLSDSVKENKQSATAEADYANNHFNIKTIGAAQIRLLIPYGMIDYKKPVKISINGRQVYKNKLKVDKNILIESFMKSRDKKFLVANNLDLDVAG